MPHQVVIMGPAAITDREAITGMEIIMGTADTTGTEIGIASE
jgi:hypothetical protein